MAAVAFGLLSAVTWGAADFGGGLASRRGPVVGVVILSQAVGAALAFLLVSSPLARGSYEQSHCWAGRLTVRRMSPRRAIRATG